MTTVFSKQKMDSEAAVKSTGSFARIPGLLRRWEIQQVVRPGAEYLIEAAGELKDGTSVFMLFQREAPDAAEQIGVPVDLSFPNGQPPLKARMVPLQVDGEGLVALLALRAGQRALLARLGELLGTTLGAPAATEGPR